MPIPVIGFSAYSGTGKTYVIERLVRCLTDRHLRVAVIKHDVHGFAMDQPGKDTWRHQKAGAVSVTITSPGQTAVLRPGGESLETCVAQVRDADLILVEGFKFAEIPRIGLYRTGNGKPLPCPAETYLAVVTDDPAFRAQVPGFSFDGTAALADFLLSRLTEASPEVNPPMALPTDFTHFNDQGRARMVDVGDKAPTHRTATAAGRLLVNEETFSLIRSGGMKKGDVLTVAQVAGIMAAKHTPDWIPMCHPVPLAGVDLKLSLDSTRLSVEIEATARCDGKTGVEMEALTAVSAAALTVYDMCKAVQRDMTIADIRLVSKTGGVHGDYLRKDEEE